MQVSEVIQLVQVGTPIAEELIRDLISLFGKHAPQAVPAQVADVAGQVAVIANQATAAVAATGAD